MSDIARQLQPHPRLLEWGARHLGLDGLSLLEWARRAWWGLAAGELAIKFLHSDDLRTQFLDLVNPPDWTSLDEARSKGGVILATAHLGPRKTAMHFCLEEPWPLLVWSHHEPGQPLPASARRNGIEVLDPIDPTTASFILGRTALHLREGGLLFAAADAASSARTMVLQRLGRSWAFSPGIPILARRLGVPVFFVLALWRGLRINVTIQPIEPPSAELPEDQWLLNWIEQYWNAMEPVISSSPENLRFLRWIFSAEEVDALLAPAEIGAWVGPSTGP